VKTTSCSEPALRRPRILLSWTLGALVVAAALACGAVLAATVTPLIEVAAFGAAPVSNAGAPGEQRPLPGDSVVRREGAAAQRKSVNEFETRIAAGETWLELLGRANAPLDSETLRRASAINGIALLPPLAAGKYVRVRSIEGKREIEVEYAVSADEGYAIVLHPDGVQVKRHANDAKLIEKVRSDPAKASLFTATDAIGLPEGIVLQLVEIFAGDVDFHRELHRGYRCTLAYEVHYRDGQIDRAGRILAVDLTIQNRRLQAYYFDDGKGGGYYSETGRAMKKMFRKSPVEFSRITSDYTLARFHPILGLWRAHRGVDYAAPLGSKVVATADGTVDFLGERGDLGKLVILQHQNRFRTYYGHLNGFAPGLAPGNIIETGQVIGYVGMTGLATGPHVHYEFHVLTGAGEWTSMPAPEHVEAPPVNSAAYFRAVESYRGQLALAASAHFVILD
jgi:murein DD-endopeptidase MepM/ murein hydrolase activator NlpD